MTDARTITCVNGEMSLIFSRANAADWFLSDFSGIYGTNYNVVTSDYAMLDGSQYYSSRVAARNIVLTVSNRMHHRYSRDLLYRTFRPRSEGTLIYSDGQISRKIYYYTESCQIESKGVRSDDSGIMTATISLICPDPFFYDLEETTVSMSAYLPVFKFQHEFTADMEQFGYREAEKIRTISNESGMENTGMHVEIYCTGPVTNPFVTNIESGESVKTGTSDKTLSLVARDRIIITTYDADKNIYLVHDGNTSKINQYLAENSSFIQLKKGTNSIGYGADSGSDNMTVTVTYKIRYMGI